jgi:hypothetical protein
MLAHEYDSTLSRAHKLTDRSNRESKREALVMDRHRLFANKITIKFADTCFKVFNSSPRGEISRVKHTAKSQSSR